MSKLKIEKFEWADQYPDVMLQAFAGCLQLFNNVSFLFTELNILKLHLSNNPCQIAYQMDFLVFFENKEVFLLHVELRSC